MRRIPSFHCFPSVGQTRSLKVLVGNVKPFALFYQVCRLYPGGAHGGEPVSESGVQHAAEPVAHGGESEHAAEGRAAPHQPLLELDAAEARRERAALRAQGRQRGAFASCVRVRTSSKLVKGRKTERLWKRFWLKVMFCTNNSRKITLHQTHRKTKVTVA